MHINSLAVGKPRCHFKTAIFNLVLLIGIFTSSKDNALRWMPRDFTDDKSTLVQVMAWYRQATSHYLSQCWPSSMSPYGVTRPQWVNGFVHRYMHHWPGSQRIHWDSMCQLWFTVQVPRTYNRVWMCQNPAFSMGLLITILTLRFESNLDCKFRKGPAMPREFLCNDFIYLCPGDRIGTAVGMLATGVICDQFGWKWPFYIYGM